MSDRNEPGLTNCKHCGAKLVVTQTRRTAINTIRVKACPKCRMDSYKTVEVSAAVYFNLFDPSGQMFPEIQAAFDARYGARRAAPTEPASQPDTAQPIEDYAAAIRADIAVNMRLKEEQAKGWHRDDLDRLLDADNNYIDEEGNPTSYLDQKNGWISSSRDRSD